MNKKDFFTLKPESHTLSMLCISMTDSMMQDKNRFPTAQLEGEPLEAFRRLKQLIYSMQDEEGNMVPREASLDYWEAFALMHSIVQPFYSLKGHVLLPREQRKGTDESNEEIEAVFYTYKDEARDLLWQLTKAMDYPDYGLHTLEEVFEMKTGAVRPLQADNEKEVSTFTINEQNSHLFTWMYTLLDFLQYERDKYDFAERFYSCQFMHISDYTAVRNKLHHAKQGEIISLTLRDCIVFYWTLSLAGRMFMSDATEMYNEVGRKLDAGRAAGMTSKEVRDFFLRSGDNLLSDMRKKLAGNKVFMNEIEKVKEWKI